MKRYRIMCAALSLLMFATLRMGASRADIFQWEYINPDNPSEGKQRSATLCPDGAGVVAAPGVGLSGRNLTQAYLFGADLSNASLYDATLTDAFLRQANLTNANLWIATLTNADLTDASVEGVSFWFTTSRGFTKEQLYSTASYKNHDLSGIDLGGNDLTGWNFAGQNLTNARFAVYYWYVFGSTLTDADLTDAVVVGASFGGATSSGFTKEQLYSTASYKSHDLSRIGLGYNDLTGWNFAGQNLTNAWFDYTVLTNADLTDAAVVGASFQGTTSSGFTNEQLYSTASYKNHDLSGIGLRENDLTGWDFAGQNLTNADFYMSTLTNADLTDAAVVGARIAGTTSTGFTKEQLYSTVSYKNHDLSGIGLYGNDLTGWNFAGQNLTAASLSTLTDADLRGADTRGANLGWNWSTADADIANTILPDGQIDGVDLGTGQMFVVRDYDGNQHQWIYGEDQGLSDYGGDQASGADPLLPPIALIPIHVDDHFIMGPGGVLQLLFDADAWDSTISFEAGIRVMLGGTLELQLAAGVVPASQIGRTFDLFDWTGVAPLGQFDIVSPYVWDVSRLYSAGEITFVGVPEASSLTLLAVGLSSLLLRRFRRCRPPGIPLGGRFARPAGGVRFHVTRGQVPEEGGDA